MKTQRLKARTCFWTAVVWIVLSIFIWAISAFLNNGEVDKGIVWWILALIIITGLFLAYGADVVMCRFKNGGKP